jgi:hypothetical protein
MRARYLKFAIAIALALPAAHSAIAESALMGWQTVRKDGEYVYKVHMLGPTQMNKRPEAKGNFGGEFFSRKGEWKSKLIAVYKVSFSETRDLQSQKIDFKVSTTASGTNQPDTGKTEFTTQALSFGARDSFLLIFKTKVGTDKQGKDIEGIEMILLPIVPVFVPS